MIDLIKTRWPSLLCFMLLIAIVQYAGAAVTFPNIPSWYVTLNKPVWTPPNWLFGPVWTCLYLMLAVLGWRLWIELPRNKTAIRFYFAQLFFNFLWSFLFFGYHLTRLAFADLLLVILFTALLFSRLKRSWAYWLVPYLLWLCYAASLNGAIMVLN